MLFKFYLLDFADGIFQKYSTVHTAYIKMAVWQGQFITIIIISKELSNQSNGNVSVQEECRERVWRNSYFKKQACVNMSDGLALYEQLTPPSSTFLRETIVSLLVCDKHIDTAAHIQPQTEVQPPDISIFSQKHTHTRTNYLPHTNYCIMTSSLYLMCLFVS